MSAADKKANKIYARLPLWRGGERADLSPFYSEGLLKKEQLEHGKYYIGACRNARVARWNAAEQTFRHVRHKFGNVFEEDIPHPADCNGFDVFACVEETTPTTSEIVTEGFE